ncbi:hypothetical protein D3C72_319510 [compost metagenome]
MRRLVGSIALGFIALQAIPCEAALPTRGLYLSQPLESTAPAIEMMLGEGILHLGYLPAGAVMDRIWYGSLRLPVPVFEQGFWWPSFQLLLGYHRQQAPVGIPFQGVEYGTTVKKDLPLNLTLYALGTLSNSLNGSDTIQPLQRLEAGIGYKAASSVRLFAGYQSWDSPLGLGALTNFNSTRRFSAWMFGVDFQLTQLMGFPGDN